MLVGKEAQGRSTWLAQFVDHVTLDLGLVSLSPMIGNRGYLKTKNILGKKKKAQQRNSPLSWPTHQVTSSEERPLMT